MVRKLRIGFIGLLLVFGGWGILRSADRIGSIIDSAQKRETSWSAKDVDLPPTYLVGDVKSILFYAEGIPVASRDILCEELGLAELVEMLPYSAGKSDVPLSPHHPEVRFRIESSCLVRPGDIFLAVGRGTQTYVKVAVFEARKNNWGCGEKPEWGLWGVLEKPLPEDPLFFLAGETWPEGENYFYQPDPKSDVVRTDEEKAAFKEHLFYPAEFNLTVVYEQPGGKGRLWNAVRRTVSPEDQDLPNEALIWVEPGRHQALLVETVDFRRGSGHVRFEGAFDPNGDNLVDFWLTGVHHTCAYQVLFLGSPEGFWRPSLPSFPCQCVEPRFKK